MVFSIMPNIKQVLAISNRKGYSINSICIHLKKCFPLTSEFVLSILHKNIQFSSEQAGEQMVFLEV